MSHIFGYADSVVLDGTSTRPTDLSGTADAIGEALRQFAAAVSGSDGAIGSDEISGQFGREYAPLVTQAVTAIGSYQDQLMYGAGGLSLMASLLAHSEAVGAADLARLRGQWRPSPGP